jgi:hypothetical protein
MSVIKFVRLPVKSLLIFMIFLACACGATAQSFAPLPDAPEPTVLPDAPAVVAPAGFSTAVEVQSPPAPQPEETHAFWDKQNILLFSGVAVMRGLDYASTRNFQARGRKEILLPEDVVNNSAGFAALEAAATMTSVGVSYIFHRTGHHKLERWVSITHIGVTAFGDARNYALESHHNQ